jgi:hypothetical protein
MIIILNVRVLKLFVCFFEKVFFDIGFFNIKLKNSYSKVGLHFKKNLSFLNVFMKCLIEKTNNFLIKIGFSYKIKNILR